MKNITIIDICTHCYCLLLSILCNVGIEELNNLLLYANFTLNSSVFLRLCLFIWFLGNNIFISSFFRQFVANFRANYFLLSSNVWSLSWPGCNHYNYFLESVYNLHTFFCTLSKSLLSSSVMDENQTEELNSRMLLMKIQ